MRIAILGGGMAGLGAAYELSESGHTVELFEKSTNLGGLAESLTVGGHPIEQYYHHMFPTYHDFFEVADRLGFREKFWFKPARTGIWYGGRVHAFSGPLDLLRFQPLTILERIRTAAVLMYLKFNKSWVRFEDVGAADWLKRWFGYRAYEVLWEPLLTSKFGDEKDRVSMAWFWSRIYERPSTFGYFEGGFQTFVQRLADFLTSKGVLIHTASPAKGLFKTDAGYQFETPQGTHTFDAVIIAAPPAAFGHIAEAVLTATEKQRLSAYQYMGSICALMVLDRSLISEYWLNVNEPGSPFVAVVEHTNFAPKEYYGGRTIVYLSKYLDPVLPEYARSNEEIWSHWLPMVKKINPAFQEHWIVESYIFRAPATQPVIPISYSKILPHFKTSLPNLLWVSMSHIYPWDRGTDHSFHYGREAARELLCGKP